MRLIHRKRRPIKRDTDTKRDDRLFIIACDDTYAPKQYFDFFKITRIQVLVVPTEDGTSTAKSVLNRLLEYEHDEHDEDDELWMLLDTDHCTEGEHVREFNRAIKEAGEKNVNVALIKPCFEVWLLLHHVNEEEVKKLSNATEAEKLLRSTLGEYNKKNLKSGHYPINLVPIACQRAKNLDLAETGGRIPNINTSRIYKLWSAISAKGLPSQLPVELKDL